VSDRAAGAVLVTGGDVVSPAAGGSTSVLVAAATILNVGVVDARAVDAIGLEVETLDARGCLVVPGFIDPHEHIIGGSGERGFASRTPEIFCRELVPAGITTVVGVLGTDTTMKTLPDLLAKTRALDEESLTALMYTGGYVVPPTTMLGGVREDIMFIDKVIGVGEVAIADPRSLEPTARDLARIVIDARVAGTLSGKAGVTHLHVGDGASRLRVVREAIDSYGLDAQAIYPTHVQRSRELLGEAVDLTRRGSFVDIDTTTEDVPRWLDAYRDMGGDFERLTLSTDAGGSSPGRLLDQVRACVHAGWPVDIVLPLVTRNTARALQLRQKGVLRAGADADLVVLEKRSLELRHVVARGTILMKDGALRATPAFLEGSDRRIELHGTESQTHQTTAAR
jgi:beta-aspartyl-dipeptidase (metallo-type)